MRIIKHWEEINSQKRYNMNHGGLNGHGADSSGKAASQEPGTLPQDYGMSDAKTKAESMLKERII
jgi:hypothetical protein